MKILKVPISSVIPWDKNPRGIRTEDLERLKRQIQKLGVYKPLVCFQAGKKYVVLGGNMRIRALQELGVREVEISLVAPKNEAERIEFALSDNDRAGYYEEKLLGELLQPYLAQLNLEDFKVDLGKAVDLKFLVQNLALEYDEKANDAPSIDDKPAKTKPGQAFQLGPHKLMCGDSTKPEDFKKLMGKSKADMVFTDPPYNVDYGSNKKHPEWKVRAIQNDKLSRADWLEFNKAVFSNISSHYKGGDIYVWGASGPEGMVQRLLLTEQGFHWSATIVWKKDQLVLSPAKYQRLYEPCFYGWLSKSSFAGDRKQLEVWDFPRPKKSEEHPTMKPVELCTLGIRNSSKKGDLVLDPFLGSGSTMIACEKIDRACFGMELDPKYCDVIIKRYADFAGVSEEKIRRTAR